MMSIDKISNKSDLIEYLNQGQPVKYLFFWGHQPKLDGSIGKGCLSQWWSERFTVDDLEYFSAEHYIMAEKARLFADSDALEKILSAKHPGAAKQFGRAVRGFNEQVWREHRFDIVVRANLGKFGQNARLQEYLLTTGKRVLVEASPRDKIWGIGLTEDNPAASNPLQWKGENLLGFALMEVREQLKEAARS